MGPSDQSNEAAKVAIDAVFQQEVPLAGLQAATPTGDRLAPLAGGAAPKAAEPDEQPAPTDLAVLFLPPGPPPAIQSPPPAAVAKPPLADYVRELGLEYQEQQEEGRL